jgi:hypothetical protein
MLLLVLVVVIAGTFFGGGLYVSLVAHPARMAAGNETALREFRQSYHRAAAMMGALSTLGCLLGLAAAYRLDDWHLAINAVLLGLPVPVTLLIIAPTNRRLLHPALDVAGPETTALLARWGRLHAIRTILGGLAFALFLFRLTLHCAG